MGRERLLLDLQILQGEMCGRQRASALLCSMFNSVVVFHGLQLCSDVSGRRAR